MGANISSKPNPSYYPNHDWDATDSKLREIPEGSIQIVQGDIMDLTVDGIVNAANVQLRNGGGINGAIHARAGAEALQAKCQALSPIRTETIGPCCLCKVTYDVRCEVSDCRITSSCGLPKCQYILHAVGKP